jgi:hypothetical protein
VSPAGEVRPESTGFFDLLLLSRTRALVRRPVYRIVALSIALAYAIGSMLIGGMLQVFIPPVAIRSFWLVIPSGYPWWDYPGLLVVTPGFVLGLPFLPTISMVVVSAGVGIGMTVAGALTVNLLRRRKSQLGRPAAVSSVAGLTPAMIALVTLGACCSTTAVATAGVGLAAQASGTTINALLLNNWYLGLFQIGILYAALLAQEQLLAVYGFLFRRADGAEPLPEMAPSRRVDRHFVGGASLRVALLAGGVTWSLAMFASWTTVSPVGASAGVWFSWLAQYQFLALTAIVAALMPLAFTRFLSSPGRPIGRTMLRGAWIVLGFSLAGWTPPGVASWGVYGFVNELLGVLGLPASTGAILPGQAWGLALALRWVFQFLLLGGFALWVGIAGARVAPILTASSSSNAPADGPMDACEDRSTSYRRDSPATFPAEGIRSGILDSSRHRTTAPKPSLDLVPKTAVDPDVV